MVLLLVTMTICEPCASLPPLIIDSTYKTDQNFKLSPLQGGNGHERLAIPWLLDFKEPIIHQGSIDQVEEKKDDKILHERKGPFRVQESNVCHDT